MDTIRPLSYKVTYETWMFIGVALLVVVLTSVLHTRFTQEEYYTMRQRVQIQSLLAHATRNVASGHSLQESLTIYDVLHRIISERHARTIFHTDLTKLYEKTQAMVAKRVTSQDATSAGQKEKEKAIITLPLPIQTTTSSPSHDKKKAASPIWDAIVNTK